MLHVADSDPEVAVGTVEDELDLALAVAKAIDMFVGLSLSMTPTSPNWNEPSTRTTFFPSSLAAATATLTAIVVRPTPPFGLKNATTWPSRAWVRPLLVDVTAGVGRTSRPA